MKPKQDYRSYILREFERRQKKNPAYSLRAFSRDLEIPCSRLSEILNRKRGLSQRRAPLLADKLYLSPSEKEYFVDLALCEHARSGLVKNMAVKRIHAREAVSMDEAVFSIVSDWYHTAILEYLQLPNKPHDLQTIATCFGLQTEVVEKALERLQGVHLIKQVTADKWSVLHENRNTIFSPKFEAVKKYYRQLLEKVNNNIGSESRSWDMSAATLQVKKGSIPQAIQKIRQFRQELIAEMEADPERDTVCCLTVQFFDLAEAH
ncbi:TIGR02147 family protein [Bdellovibrio sp. HCB337]|uniref:TIGR02147 family protein n=1 Tax=Bdellovibrio sp. HCB337 TaxID=3394358 RepID=UPI0039A6DC6C